MLPPPPKVEPVPPPEMGSEWLLPPPQVKLPPPPEVESESEWPPPEWSRGGCHCRRMWSRSDCLCCLG